MSIQAGCILRANGGYLILDASDLLSESGTWKVLVRTLSSGMLEIIPPELGSAAQAQSLKPEPIPVEVRVILVGNVKTYRALDQDDDGQPGVTVAADTVLCRAPGELYLSLRATVDMSATIDDLDRIEGSVAPTLEQSVLGVSDRCLNAAASLDIELLDGSTFTALRTDETQDYDDNGNVSCPEMNLYAESLFGDFWAQ